jgi:predicted transcriptional regulator of viral defense system
LNNYINRLIALLLISLLCLSVAGCGQKEMASARSTGKEEYENQIIVIQGAKDGNKEVTVAEMRKLEQKELNASLTRTTGMLEEFKASGPTVKDVLALVGEDMYEYKGLGFVGRDGYYCLVTPEIIENYELVLALAVDDNPELANDTKPARLCIQGEYGPYWVRMVDKIVLYEEIPKKDLVRKIRRNIYSPVNPVTGQVVASRYQIACAITDTAYISHHSAFDYYGFANQVFYEMYVSSETKFNNFEYDHVTYKYIASKMKEGVVKAKNTTGVRITDLERTVIESIRDFNKIGGFEELLNCLEGIHYLDENKLRLYLNIYDIQGLYQKAGYLLDHYRKEMQLSKDFIDYCKRKIGKSRRYLLSETNEDSYYNSEWELMVPEGLFKITEQGGDKLV